MYLCPYSKWKYPSKTHTHGIRKQKTFGCADQLSTTRQTWQYRNISTQRGQNNERLLKRRKNIRTMAANHLGAHGRVLEAKRKRRMKQYTGSLWTADGEKKLETKTVLLWRHESIQSCSSSSGRMGGGQGKYGDVRERKKRTPWAQELILGTKTAICSDRQQGAQ